MTRPKLNTTELAWCKERAISDTVVKSDYAVEDSGLLFDEIIKHKTNEELLRLEIIKSIHWEYGLRDTYLVQVRDAVIYRYMQYQAAMLFAKG